MASLITHMRIANTFIGIIEKISPVHFIMGSIAPDCGETPQITHWTHTGEKNDIRSQDFFNAYIKNESSDDKKSFYLGYYIHLLADIAWWNYVWIPASIKFKQEITQDKSFIKDIKKDWQYIDYLFLCENKDCEAFRILEETKIFPNIYLDYYSEDIFENMIERVDISLSVGENSSKFISYISYGEIYEIIEKIVSDIKNCLSKNSISIFH